MNALKLTWIKKLLAVNGNKLHARCMKIWTTLTHMGSLYNYSKEIHSYRFWEDTFKVYERTEKKRTTLKAKKNNT